MTVDAALGVLAGLAVGGGLALLIIGLLPRPETEHVRPGQMLAHLRRPLATTVPVAALAAAAVLVLTRWPIAAVAAAVAALVWRWLLGGGSAGKAAVARLEALAAWVESLRDTIATGTALPEALPASVPGASPLLRPALEDLAARLRARQPVEQALMELADTLDDPAADEIIAALILTARVQGRRLHAVLTSLAASARRRAQTRRQVEAERRATRRAVQIILGVTALTVLGMATLNPAYVEPYGTGIGQVVLALVLALFAAGLAWIRRLADFDAPSRFLASPLVRASRAREPDRAVRGAARRWAA